MRGVTKLAVLAATLVLPISLTACSSGGGSRTADSPSVIEAADHEVPGRFLRHDGRRRQEVRRGPRRREVVYGQGKSGTDDEGQIAIIENMIVQQVKAIAITPTSPNVQAALEKAVKAGIKVVLVDNDIPGWTGKSSVVATNNLAGGQFAGTWLTKSRPDRNRDPSGPVGNPSLDDRVKGLK